MCVKSVGSHQQFFRLKPWKLGPEILFWVRKFILRKKKTMMIFQLYWLIRNIKILLKEKYLINNYIRTCRMVKKKKKKRKNNSPDLSGTRRFFSVRVNGWEWQYWNDWKPGIINLCQSTSLSLYYLENHNGGTVEHINDVNGLSHCFPTVQCQDRG